MSAVHLQIAGAGVRTCILLIAFYYANGAHPGKTVSIYFKTDTFFIALGHLEAYCKSISKLLCPNRYCSCC